MYRAKGLVHLLGRDVLLVLRVWVRPLVLCRRRRGWTHHPLFLLLPILLLVLLVLMLSREMPGSAYWADTCSIWGHLHLSTRNLLSRLPPHCGLHHVHGVQRTLVSNLQSRPFSLLGGNCHLLDVVGELPILLLCPARLLHLDNLHPVYRLDRLRP